MRQTALLLSFLLSGTAFAADPQLMNLVMPDAKILAGVNATSALSSPLGQFLISRIGLNAGIPQGLMAAIGFNPLLDVSEILAATTADPSSPGGLVLARGTFPVDKIGTALKGNWQSSTYGGATLISNTNPNSKVVFAVAFLGNSIAVMGDLASVKAAIDRSTGSNSIDPALAVTVNQLSGSEDEWLASSASVGSLLPAKAAVGVPASGPAAQLLPLLKSIQSFDGGVKFGDTVALTGELVESSPQNAAALNAVIKLGLLMVESAGGNSPGKQQLAGVIQLFQTLQVAANGSAVDLSLSMPEAQIESLLNSAPVGILGVKPAADSRKARNGN